MDHPTRDHKIKLEHRVFSRDVCSSISALKSLWECTIHKKLSENIIQIIGQLSIFFLISKVVIMNVTSGFAGGKT